MKKVQQVATIIIITLVIGVLLYWDHYNINFSLSTTFWGAVAGSCLAIFGTWIVTRKTIDNDKKLALYQEVTSCTNIIAINNILKEQYDGNDEIKILQVSNIDMNYFEVCAEKERINNFLEREGSKIRLNNDNLRVIPRNGLFQIQKYKDRTLFITNKLNLQQTDFIKLYELFIELFVNIVEKRQNYKEITIFLQVYNELSGETIQTKEFEGKRDEIVLFTKSFIENSREEIQEIIFKLSTLNIKSVVEYNEIFKEENRKYLSLLSIMNFYEKGELLEFPPLKEEEFKNAQFYVMYENVSFTENKANEYVLVREKEFCEIMEMIRI